MISRPGAETDPSTRPNRSSTTMKPIRLPETGSTSTATLLPAGSGYGTSATRTRPARPMSRFSADAVARILAGRPASRNSTRESGVTGRVTVADGATGLATDTNAPRACASPAAESAVPSEVEWPELHEYTDAGMLVVMPNGPFSTTSAWPCAANGSGQGRCVRVPRDRFRATNVAAGPLIAMIWLFAVTR